MTNHCEFCPLSKKCSLANQILFCEDCRYFDDCDILAACEAGEYIECNNGFEPKDEGEND